MRPTPRLAAAGAAALSVALLSSTASTIGSVPVAPPAAFGAPASPAAPDPATGAERLRAPYQQVADELDLTTVIPALEARFGYRYGGFWLEPPGRGRPADILHVGVVDARPADRTAVAQIVGRHPRVVTDAVTHGYKDLVAAQEEVAATLDPATTGSFAVDTDVATNRIVVHAAGDPRRTAAQARDAVRRGVGPRAPSDVADAVDVVPTSDVAVELLGSSRGSFPPYEAGLDMVVAYGRTINRCTTGFLFRNYYGWFGSTAGHCGPGNGGVAVGPRIVDAIRLNTYYPDRTVRADVGMYSLSILRWPAHPVVHGNGYHRRLTGKFANSQLGTGLRLCFEGVASDSGNCGSIVRSNTTVCCDGSGRSFVFTCINFPPLAGDSGGPVYHPSGTRTIAAGMVSAAVTINGRRSMCFTTIANIEARTNSRLIL